jgi:hypothetical protein
MFIVNTTQLKDELHGHIEDFKKVYRSEGGPLSPKYNFRDEVLKSIKASRVALDADQLSSQLHKLMLANNFDRAKRLVNVLDNHALTWGGAFVKLILVTGLKLGALMAVILFTIWAAQSCGIL